MSDFISYLLGFMSAFILCAILAGDSKNDARDLIYSNCQKNGVYVYEDSRIIKCSVH